MAEALKHLYSKKFIASLSTEIKKERATFNEELFQKNIFSSRWNALELKERMRHITTTLFIELGENYKTSLEILAPVSKKFCGFEHMFFPDFVEVYGLDHWDISMNALEEFTKGSSSEFAVRPFIKMNKEKMMKQMNIWSGNKNHHVRRLASEGCRPRLPWAMALPEFKKEPAPILPILEKLKDDDSEYVRRSVANNLNDISKDHPSLVLKIAKEWHGKSLTRNKLVKHACRTMLKKGEQEALSIFGFGKPASIKIKNLKTKKKNISVGGELEFSFNLLQRNDKNEMVRLEYAIHYKKANGTLSKKVFKISEKVYGKGDTSITKKHSFKVITTRKLHSGRHELSLIVNGVEMDKVEFGLKK